MRRKRIDHEFYPPGAAVRSTPPEFLIRNRKRPTIQLLFLCLAALFFSTGGLAAESCLVDTSQAQFQLGIPTNVDLLPVGDVVLAATDSVDQENTNLSSTGYSFHSYHWYGQTFKAGVSGPLSAVELRLFCSACTGTMPDITVSLRATEGGVPVGGDLSTATIPGFTSAGGQFFKAVFETPLNVTKGTVYAIIVRASSLPTSGSYAYLVSGTPDTYSAGTRLTSETSGIAWSVREYDVGFRTLIGSGFVDNGNLISSLKDSSPPAGTTPVWTKLSWDAATPGSTDLQFQVAGSNLPTGPFNFVGPDGTAGTFFRTSGASLDQFSGSRFLRYKALLSNTNPSATPALREATVCYDSATVSSADLQISKTNGTSTSTPGAQTTYSIVASNAGPSDVTSATVTDTFGSDLQNCSWTCSGAGGGSCPASGSGNINHAVSLPAGASTTFVAR